jgi:hypothetical protein
MKEHAHPIIVHELQVMTPTSPCHVQFPGDKAGASNECEETDIWPDEFNETDGVLLQLGCRDSKGVCKYPEEQKAMMDDLKNTSVSGDLLHAVSQIPGQASTDKDGFPPGKGEPIPKSKISFMEDD